MDHLQDAEGCGGLFFVYRGVVVSRCFVNVFLLGGKQLDMYRLYLMVGWVGINAAMLFLFVCVFVASIAFCWLF